MSRKTKSDPKPDPKPDPYFEVKLACQMLQDEGVHPDMICDALMCVGLNAANRMHGPAFVDDYLRSMIGVFAAKAAGDIDAPPTAH
jgi:hypothetical protein